jgi:hypothetical protein
VHGQDDVLAGEQVELVAGERVLVASDRLDGQMDRVRVADQPGPAKIVEYPLGRARRDLQDVGDLLERLRVATVDVDPQQLVGLDTGDDGGCQPDVAVTLGGVVKTGARSDRDR